MGMPHTFNIDNVANFNHICQTVPVHTARAWVEVAAKWCSDPKIFPTASSSFVVQNNISRKVESVKVEFTMAEALPEKRKSGRLLKNVGPKEKKRLIG